MTFDELRNLAAGFQPSKLLLVALDLGVFDTLGSDGRTAGDLAVRLGLDPRATEIVLNALVAMGLLELLDGKYRNGEAARRFLARGGDDDRGDILRHLHATWEDWDDLERTWRTGAAAAERKEGQIPASPAALRNFILGMENVTREIAPLLAEQLPLGGCRRALDLGGGPGNYALAFARRWPMLEVVHFDLPATSEIAREFVAGQPGADRISFLEGDFLEDPIGEGYDFVWASQVFHMLGEPDCRRLVERIASSLVEGGKVAIHDQFLERHKTAPRPAALFGVHMLVATREGRTYSFEEAETWLRDVGLQAVDRIDYGQPSRVLVGEKP